MDGADTAHLAAVVGALGAALILTAWERTALLGGFVLLAAAELALLRGSGGGGLDSLSSKLALLAVVALLVLAAAAAVLGRRPALVTPLVLVAAPFRPPLDVDRHHRFLVAIAHGGQLGRLLLLYAVLGAAVLAVLYAALRGEPVAAIPPWVAYPTAAFLALSSLSLLWSSDLAAGRNLLAYFLLPFAALVAVVARAPFPSWMPRALGTIAVTLASVFALVGLWQAATHRLLFFAPNLEVSNTYTSYFRVTSLFRDPSLYGRHLVLGIAIVLVAVWLGRVHLVLGAGAIALMWAGLYFSYSQTSMAALFAVVLGVTAVAGSRGARKLAVVAAVLVVLAGGAFVANAAREHSARRVTSDRSRRVQLTARVFVHHPLAGVGLGAQPRESEELTRRGGPTARFVSHTTPLTVAAELGLLGVVAYAALLAGAARLLLGLLRRDTALALALGAVLAALFVHALFYSGFFEDPITWLALAIAAAASARRSPEPAAPYAAPVR